MARSTSIAAPLMVLAAAAFIVSWLGVDVYFQMIPMVANLWKYVIVYIRSYLFLCHVCNCAVTLFTVIVYIYILDFDLLLVSVRGETVVNKTRRKGVIINTIIVMSSSSSTFSGNLI